MPLYRLLDRQRSSSRHTTTTRTVVVVLLLCHTVCYYDTTCATDCKVSALSFSRRAAWGVHTEEPSMQVVCRSFLVVVRAHNTWGVHTDSQKSHAHASMHACVRMVCRAFLVAVRGSIAPSSNLWRVDWLCRIALLFLFLILRPCQGNEGSTNFPSYVPPRIICPRRFSPFPQFSSRTPERNGQQYECAMSRLAIVDNAKRSR